MNYNFKPEDQSKIIQRFGAEFFTNISGLFEPLTVKWEIDALELIQSFSANLVFKGNSRHYGPVILKFCEREDEFLNEVNALKYFEGDSCCKLYDVESQHRVLLEEAIVPGSELVAEKDIDKRLDIFCELYRRLHLNNNNYYNDNDINDLDIRAAVNQPLKHKSYRDWVFRIAEFMQAQVNWSEIAHHMTRAKALYESLARDYSRVALLHGDFHYYNILKGEERYKIIDPKGVIGDPIFDIPRYMLNEFWDVEDKEKVDDVIDKVFERLSNELNLPRAVLSKLLYIEGAMAISWCVEDGEALSEKGNYIVTLEQLAVFMMQNEVEDVYEFYL